MSTMRMHEDTFQWFQTHPQMWWAAQARWAFGKVAPGVPGIETEADGETPTGYLLFSHPGIDYRDLYILEVCEAGMAFAIAQEDLQAGAATYLVALQAEKDYAALIALRTQIEAGTITLAEAVEQIWAYVQELAETLGVPAYVAPVEEPV